METELQIIEDSGRTKKDSFIFIQEKITKESSAFIQEYIKEEYEVSQTHLDIINTYELLIPYENFFQLLKLHEGIYNLFLRYDPAFASKSLKKLSFNIQKVAKAFEEFKKKSEKPKRYLLQELKQRSDLFFLLSAELVRFKKKHSFSSNIQRELKILEEDKLQLEHFYFSIFKDLFLEEIRMLQMDFKLILNCYSYYFDILLWWDAKRSEKIIPKLTELGITEFSTQSYIRHKLATTHTYSTEYHYLTTLKRHLYRSNL